MATQPNTLAGGIIPIYNPDARWSTWSLDEIYTGGDGAGRYVPLVNDYVVDTDTDERYRVIDLDITTLIPRLQKITTSTAGATFSDEDLLLGVGPGTQSDTYRCYIDTSVLPHTLTVEMRLHIYGSAAATCVLFKGSELLGTQKAVSAVFDQSGALVSQAIPLELVAMPGQKNLAIKAVPVCYTTDKLQDGEVLTAVIFSATGHVVSKRQLLVENTPFIRAPSLGVKYITSISLESPFLSTSDPDLIQYPINVPLQGMNLIGVVHYSDGSTLRQPVDNTKFQVFGLENFVATIVDQKIPLVLKYNLSANEYGINQSTTSDRFIARNYRATTVRAEGVYAVKLFAYPVWVSPQAGYRLEWYLYNLDRQLAFRVTSLVRINENTRAFDPLAYGVSQRLSVSVNLKEVHSAFTSYIHVQAIDVVLLNAGTDPVTNWTIGFEPGQNPPYGRQNAATIAIVNQNLKRLKIDLGATTLAAWLQRAYYDTKPLVDVTRELAAPEPNYFSLLIGGTEVAYPISQWNTEFALSQSFTVNDTLFVKFFKRTAENDIQLAIAGFPLKAI